MQCENMNLSIWKTYKTSCSNGKQKRIKMNPDQGMIHFKIKKDTKILWYHRECYKSNTTGAINGAGAVYLSRVSEFIPCFSGIQIFTIFCFLCFVDHYLFDYLWFLLITSLVSYTFVCENDVKHHNIEGAVI